MTELQKVFLFYTFVYFLIKGGLYVCLYVATVMAEKRARERHAKLKVYLHKKRTAENARWKVAHDLYNRKYNTTSLELKKVS
jgi:hypothetical protein